MFAIHAGRREWFGVAVLMLMFLIMFDLNVLYLALSHLNVGLLLYTL